MDQHARRHGGRAAGSHGTVETEHGATPETGDRPPEQTSRLAAMAGRVPPTVSLPIIAALAFGCFTIFRAHAAGMKGGPALLYGVAAAVVTGALGLVVVHFQRTMLTETRAIAYGALFGAAVGWNYSLGGETVLKSSGFGFALGAVMLVTALYIFRTHRVREPHGEHRPHERRFLPPGTHRALPTR
ncbi:hypothetical protein [Streptomyces sp. NBRC 110611]|uniref:hypothetical protein n=1 Tax=Streptomyces sp. NBRC 110611 TaxID=1621259 RepID=UPI00082CEA1F|nr:hypothetical protein [Streptomyces sp. NBRC 110611]